MTEKHYIWAADFIINEYRTVRGADIYIDFRELTVYKAFIKFFSEFGKEFDVHKFNLYIKKRITN